MPNYEIGTGRKKDTGRWTQSPSSLLHRQLLARPSGNTIMKLPQFSLRTLFILTAFVSIAVCCTINGAKWAEQRTELMCIRHRMSGKLRQISESKEPMHLGVLRYHSGPIGIEVRESELATAKALFPEADW